MIQPDPIALAKAADVVHQCQHADNPHMIGDEWVELACADCIALALTEQAREIATLTAWRTEHEVCIEEIGADRLSMVNRENELHEEKDKRLAEQAREIERLRDAIRNAERRLSRDYRATTDAWYAAWLSSPAVVEALKPRHESALQRQEAKTR